MLSEVDHLKHTCSHSTVTHTPRGLLHRPVHHGAATTVTTAGTESPASPYQSKPLHEPSPVGAAARLSEMHAALPHSPMLPERPYVTANRKLCALHGYSNDRQADIAKEDRMCGAMPATSVLQPGRNNCSMSLQLPGRAMKAVHHAYEIHCMLASR